MKWNEVKVTTESEAVEAVSNILMEAGASGVAIEDALDFENYQEDQYGELLDKETFSSLTEGAVVMAYFQKRFSCRKFCPSLKRRSKNYQSLD